MINYTIEQLSPLETRFSCKIRLPKSVSQEELDLIKSELDRTFQETIFSSFDNSILCGMKKD